MRTAQIGIISRRHSSSPTGSGGSTTPFTLSIIPFSNIDLVSPGRAANSFYGGGGSSQTNIPDLTQAFQTLDDDTRFLWSQLQPNTAGVYNFAPFDSSINAAISAGKKFSFGIVTACSTCTSGDGIVNIPGGGTAAYPVYVHTAMQGEATKDWLCSEGNSWVPNWNSNTYLTQLETFLNALSNHINTTTHSSGKTYRDAIFKVDVRGFGNYGEWHTFGICRGSEPANTVATEASLTRIINAFITAFPNYPLICNVNMFNADIPNNIAYYALSASSAWGKMGWRSDHLGATGTYNFDIISMAKTVNGLDIKDAALNRWKFAPINGELMNNTSDVSAGGSSPFWQLETQVRNQHQVQFSNVNNLAPGTAANANIINSSKACGYRLQISSGSISPSVNSGGIFKLTANWENVGITPTYEKWDVIVGFKNSGGTKVWEASSSFKPFLFLTGSRSVTDTFTLPALSLGTYTAYIAIRESRGYRLPLPLANTGRQADGSYIIRTVNVV